MNSDVCFLAFLVTECHNKTLDLHCYELPYTCLQAQEASFTQHEPISCILSLSFYLMPRFQWKVLFILKISGQKLGNLSAESGDILNQLELEICQVLNWRMLGDAAIEFVKFFVSTLTKKGDQQKKAEFESDAIKVLFNTQKGKLPKYISFQNMVSFS